MYTENIQVLNMRYGKPLKKKKRKDPRYFLHEDSLDNLIDRRGPGHGLGDPFGHGVTGKRNIPEKGVIDMRTVDTSSMEYADQVELARLMSDGTLTPCTSSADCKEKRVQHEQLESIPE